MRQTAITIPAFVSKKTDPDKKCCCENKQIEMAFKSGVIFWKKKPGDSVQVGEILCELEIEKFVAELEATVNGKLVSCELEDGEQFQPDDVLGYIEEAG